MSANAPKSMSVDAWGPGLRFGVKALNTRSVKRAATPAEVLPVCLAHNLRQGNHDHRHRSHIDPSRTCMNEVLSGPDDLSVAVDLVRDTLESLCIEPKRRDAIMGVELVFQPPHGTDLRQFWAACQEWARGRFEYVVSAVVHHDQKRPHLHILAMAVSGGKLAGNEMTASPNRPMQRRADFMGYMRRTMGLRPDRKVKTLADLAVSTGKGPKTRAAAERKDAALLRRSVEAKRTPPDVGMGVGGLGGSDSSCGNPHAHRPPVIAQLSRVEKVHLLWALIADLKCTPDSPLESPPRGPQKPERDEANEVVRERDDAMPADCWDGDTGTFMPKAANHQPNKAAARAWVSAALSNVKGKPAGLPREHERTA